MRVACLGGGPAGLYFAISMKLRDPSHDIVVVERNRANDTFGWGVVLSDDALENLQQNDPASADADYLVPSDGSLALNWTGVGFDSSSWTSGPGNSVGYERTGSDYLPYFTIDVQDIFLNVDSSIYMRIPFNVADKSLVQSLTLGMRCSR